VGLSEDMTALRRHLDGLARVADPDLDERYAMQRPQRPPGLYWQARWLAGRMLRWLESLGILPSDPWPARLKHAGNSGKAKPLLIWAVGVEREALRHACHALSTLLDTLPGFAPVLVTDVADFARYSRLGWLVEYLPRIEGTGDAFEDRKMRFIARLYRGAPVIPPGVHLASPEELAELRRRLAHGR
jgi:hypothetical protein